MDLNFEVVLRSAAEQEVTIGDLTVSVDLTEEEEGDVQVHMDTGMIAEGLRAMAGALEGLESSSGER